MNADQEKEKPTTETRRHGEEENNLLKGKSLKHGGTEEAEEKDLLAISFGSVFHPW